MHFFEKINRCMLKKSPPNWLKLCTKMKEKSFVTTSLFMALVIVCYIYIKSTKQNGGPIYSQDILKEI